MDPEDHSVITQPCSWIIFRKFHPNTNCCLIKIFRKVDEERKLEFLAWARLQMDIIRRASLFVKRFAFCSLNISTTMPLLDSATCSFPIFLSSETYAPWFPVLGDVPIIYILIRVNFKQWGFFVGDFHFKFYFELHKEDVICFQRNFQH